MADKKVKLQKTLGDGQRTSLSYLEKSSLIRKIVLLYLLEKLTLKKSANNEVFEHIKNTFEMEIDNEI